MTNYFGSDLGARVHANGAAPAVSDPGPMRNMKEFEQAFGPPQRQPKRHVDALLLALTASCIGAIAYIATRPRPGNRWPQRLRFLG